jgi:large subunit ribosomal protein L23
MSSTTKSPYEIIVRPIVTEKTVDAGAQNKYVFEVARDANKYEIALAVEQIQADSKNTVKVTAVNTLIVKGKSRQGRFFKRANRGRTSDWKKAIVTLAAGQQIELVEGV